MRTDPSRMQHLCNSEFDDKSCVDTTNAFLLILGHHEVACVPSTTQEFIHLCQEITSDHMQHVVHPNTLTRDQEEWVQWHERLNYMPHTQTCKISHKGILPRSLRIFTLHLSVHLVLLALQNSDLGDLKMDSIMPIKTVTTHQGVVLPLIN